MDVLATIGICAIEIGFIAIEIVDFIYQIKIDNKNNK